LAAAAAVAGARTLTTNPTKETLNMKTFAIAILLAGSMLAYAQDKPAQQKSGASAATAAAPQPKPSQPTPAQPAAAPAATKPVQPALPPELSELKKTQMENIQLKFTLAKQQEQVLQQQEQNLQEQWNALILAIEKEYPGWVWNPTTNSLMKKP
jgi:hypothetical protein